jgi:hypothetical protein
MSKELQRIVIKEELVELLEGDFFEAALLNNLIFWQGRQNNSDKTLEGKIAAAERKGLSEKHINRMKDSRRHGWFYKSLEEMLDNLMGWKSQATLSRAVKGLEKKGYLLKGNNPDPRQKWDRTSWYKVDLEKIINDLYKLGYALEGYALPEQPQEPQPAEEETEENTDETAPLPIFQNENCIFQNERSSLQNEKSSLQNERTIPESITKGFTERDLKDNKLIDPLPLSDQEQEYRTRMARESMNMINNYMNSQTE